MKILLAEDDKVCQNAIKTFSKKYGIECHVANNGVEAYEYCKANNDYSVILMDLGMEPMDGYQATKEIRSLSYGPNFNIIALSGDDLNCECMQKLGFNNCLKKPLSRSSFETLIKSLSG